MKEIERREKEKEILRETERETEIAGTERETETEKHSSIKVKTIDPPVGEFIVPEEPGVDCLLPGGTGDRNFSIPIDGPSLPICLGYGPGIEAPYLESTRSYMSGTGSPKTVSEVYLCPGINPALYLRNPMRCLIGGDRGLIATFVDAFVDDGLILQLARAILAPLAAEFFLVFNTVSFG